MQIIEVGNTRGQPNMSELRFVVPLDAEVGKETEALGFHGSVVPDRLLEGCQNDGRLGGRGEPIYAVTSGRGSEK